MHKQLLSTAFAAFLALALVICVISPMAEGTGDEAMTEESSVAAEAAQAPETEPIREAVSETEPIPEPTGLLVI